MISAELNMWLSDNAQSIEDQLRAFQQKRQFPVSTLKLSNQMLCDAIWDIQVPPGFARRNMYVVCPQKSIKIPHNVRLSGNNVLDFLAGQFYTVKDTGFSGIDHMVSLAPHLFQQLTAEVTAMYGSRAEILEILKLDYQYPR